jgi:hypothetical protein
MYKTHPNMQELPPETILWRYMDFISFYSLLVNQALFFRRLDKYSDAFEGTLPEQTQQNILAVRKSVAYTNDTEANEWLANYLAQIAEHKSFILSNSWTIDDHESYGLWKIYLGGHVEGIAIKTTVGKLRQAFIHGTGYEVSCGKVAYEALDHKNLNVYKVATTKRSPYAYEKEYRALIINQFITRYEENGSTKKRIPKFEVGENVTIDTKSLIESLYISPFSGEWFKGLLLTTLDNLFPDFDKTNIVCSNIQDK